jgi:hypothetical protein
MPPPVPAALPRVATPGAGSADAPTERLPTTPPTGAPDPAAPPPPGPGLTSSPAPAPPPIKPARNRSRPGGGVIALAGIGLLVAAAIGVGIGWLIFDDNNENAISPIGPTVVVSEQDQSSNQDVAATDLGFPGFATLNTTRVGGPDPTSSAAGVALASHPSEGNVGRPRMVTLVPADSWQAGIAASSLSSPAVGSPVLLSDTDGLPAVTASAIAKLQPTGVKRADGAQMLAIGGVAAPDNLKALTIASDDPATIADEIDKRRAKLSGNAEPDHIVVVSSEESDFAMPAAAWAARSGDPVVFAAGDDVPKQTLDVLERHKDASIYVLGPEDVISAKAVKTLAVDDRKPVRIEGEDAVTNSIEFARFADGSFGWNINDPGHGLVIANTSLPADAGAAASLSATGKPGPLLLTDDADTVPVPLRGFLLDTKPGYVDDPTRAVYNHIWLIGDDAAISVAFQAEVDGLTALTKVTEGTGVPADTGSTDDSLGPAPGTPESDPGGRLLPK